MRSIQGQSSPERKAIPAAGQKLFPLPFRGRWRAAPGWVFLLFALLTPACAQSNAQPVIAGNALTTTQVGGLSNTNATADVVPVTGEPFLQELKVTIRENSDQTNATQLTMPIAIPVNKGDAILASFYVRGSGASANAPAQLEMFFEKSTDPWTKSVSHSVVADANPALWTHVLVPFASTESYQPGEAMVSLRFAFGPQTIEVGGLSVLDYGTSKSPGDLEELVAQMTPLGNAAVKVDLADTKQTIIGFGGDFCQPRYGSSDALDPVGEYNLSHLDVAQARVGIPLNYWEPEKGTFTDTGPAHAALLQMQELAQRHIPIIGTVWEGPTWMLPGKPEQSGRTLSPDEYSDCIDAVIRFLTTARDTYGANVAYFSFNEANYGVNFLFTPVEIADFIRQAGPHFQAAGLKTKFLVGDTTGGQPLPSYVRPILQDKSIAPFLGPIAFHCWDVLDSSDASYAQIAALGEQYHKPIYCTEAGWDSALWQRADPWASWDNALNTAVAYAKTLNFSGASTMDYWTYENNYPLVSQDGIHPYPVFSVIKQMEDALPKGCKIASAVTQGKDLMVLVSSGPKAGQFSLLLINPDGAGSVKAAGLPANASVSVVESDSHDQDTPVASTHTDSAGTLTVPLPQRSVVTVIGS